MFFTAKNVIVVFWLCLCQFFPLNFTVFAKNQPDDYYSHVLSLCVAAGRVFSVAGGSFLDVGVTLSGRTSATFQVRAAEFAVVRLTPRREVYAGNMYELVLTRGWTNIRQVGRICTAGP